MDLTTLLILIGIVVVVVAAIVFAFAKQYKKVGPNMVLVVSGGKERTITEPDGTKRKVGYRIQIGGGTFVLPLVETTMELPLETYTLSIKTPEVLTKQGVHLIAEASAQVKVASDELSIGRAAEQFLGGGAAAIKQVATHILEGYMRNLLGARTVEEIYQKRDEFARQVRKDCADDFTKMGLEVLSFNLMDISDSQGYIQALGMPRIAQVKRDAAVAQAEATRDTAIKTAEARKEGDVVRFQVETQIAEASRDYELKRSEFQIELNRRKASADLAYELERNKVALELKESEYRTKLLEKDGAIQVEEKEIRRRELELESSVNKPAQARKQQIQAEAEAEKYRITTEAEGRAAAHIAEGAAKVEITRQEGISRVEYTRKLGLAEAEAMKAKAEAFANYNEAAVYQMALEKTPEIAKSIAEPLSRIEKIVMVGDGASGVGKLAGITAEVVAQVLPVFKALTGKDLLKGKDEETPKA